FEALQTFRVTREFRRQQLDGYHAVEDVVTRRVDDPHSSGPEAIENLVPANATAARQLHDGRCVDGSAGWDASTTDKIEPVTVPQMLVVHEMSARIST